MCGALTDGKSGRRTVRVDQPSPGLGDGRARDEIPAAAQECEGWRQSEESGTGELQMTGRQLADTGKYVQEALLRLEQVRLLQRRPLLGRESALYHTTDTASYSATTHCNLDTNLDRY